jgi:hypothetical protein
MNALNPNSKPDHKPPSPGSIATILFAALGIYVLSIGPVARYEVHRELQNIPTPQWIQTFYRPLMLLDDTPFRPVLEWYLAMWGVVNVPHVGP